MVKCTDFSIIKSRLKGAIDHTEQGRHSLFITSYSYIALVHARVCAQIIISVDNALII